MRRATMAGILLALISVAASGARASIRYLGARTIGDGTVDLMIETDGRSGILAAPDIVAWSITLHDPGSAYPLRTLTEDGAGGTLRSIVEIGGSAVTATRGTLNFIYGLGDLQFDTAGTIRPFYQIVSSLCSTGRFGNDGGCEQFDNGADYSSGHVRYALHPTDDTLVIATAATVPESDQWLLLIVGFGLIGAMTRRRTVRFGQFEA